MFQLGGETLKIYSKTMEVLKQKSDDWTPFGRIDTLSNFLQFSLHSDVTLIAEGRPLYAHKLILASFSPFIRKILENAGPETSIFLPELGFSQLQSLLQFMYTGISHPGETSENFLQNLRTYFHPCSDVIDVNEVPGTYRFCDEEGGSKSDTCNFEDDGICIEEDGKPKISGSGLCFVKHLDDGMLEIGKNNNIDFEEPVFWPCIQCSQSFATEKALKKHIQKKHNQKHKCSHCDKVFKAARSLMYHENFHSGNKVKCDQCDKSFTSPARMNAHRIKHINPDAITCNQCDIQLSNVAALHNHKKTHTGVKNHCCEVCGKSFIYSTELNNHRRVHTGEKPYQCNICWKYFRVKNHLKDHLTTHTGEKKFSCEVCKQAFNIRSNMKRHMKKVHYSQQEEI